MSAKTPVSFDELLTLKGIDTTQTIQDQLDAGGGGSGDVVGPSSATSGNLATFSGTSGKLIQDGGTVISKVLTGFSSGAGTIAATDTVLQGFNKIAGNTQNLPVISNVLTGFSAGSSYSAIAATDNVLSAFQKAAGNTLPATIVGSALAAFSSTTGTISSSDTVVGAISKLDGNIGVLKHVPINPQSDSYALLTTDDGYLVNMTKSTASTLTVPKDATANLPVGSQVVIYQSGAGQVTIAPEDGAITIHAAVGLKISAQYGLATVIKVAANTWVASGALSA